tara:strand:+ start:224 stop:1069 length:846 start_codon:yes stop_codon:yes gene_type:complete
MRDNSDRYQPKQQADDAPVEAATQQGGIFNFSTPTEFVTLPSEGKFYPEGHPLRGVPELEIRFMTAKDEDILSSPSLLRKGTAIDRFLENVLINKNIKIADMMVGDKNALVIAARITGFGADYTAKITCNTCAHAPEHHFDLSRLGAKEREDGDELSINEDGTFNITLPTTGVEVALKPLLSSDEQKLTAILKKQEEDKRKETPLTTQLKAIIVSANGISNRAQVANFVENMPSRDSRFLREYYAKAVPNIDMTESYVCPVCLAAQEVDVPITVNFFWSRP